MKTTSNSKQAQTGPKPDFKACQHDIRHRAGSPFPVVMREHLRGPRTLFSWGVPAIRLRLQHGVRQRLPQKSRLPDAPDLRQRRKLRRYAHRDGSGIAGRNVSHAVGPRTGEIPLHCLRRNGLRRTFVRIRTAGTRQRRETGRDDSNNGCRPDNFRTRKAKVARPVLGKPNARNGRPVQRRDGGNDEEHE